MKTWGGGAGTKARSINNRDFASAVKHAYTPAALFCTSQQSAESDNQMRHWRFTNIGGEERIGAIRVWELQSLGNCKFGVVHG